MCGITAMSRVTGRSSVSNAPQLMRLACLAIEERGTDATGMGWTDKTGKVWYWKAPKRARRALHDVSLPTQMDTAIGHTRAKTQGSTANNANNHPVVDDNIVLVHNGMVWNDEALFKEWFSNDYKPLAEVDSQIIASLIAAQAEIGAEHPTDLLELLKGSAAVAWIDGRQSNAIHLARVKERPLTIGWTRKGDLIMSSTPETLDNLALWANIKVGEYRELEEGQYLKVVAGEIVEEREFTVPRDVKSYSSAWSGGSYKGPNVTQGAPQTGTTPPTTQTPPPLTIPAPDTDDEVCHGEIIERAERPAGRRWFQDDDFMDSVGWDSDDYGLDDESYLKWSYENLRQLYEEGRVEYDEVLGAYTDWQASRGNGAYLDFIVSLTDDEYEEFDDYRFELRQKKMKGELNQADVDYLMEEFVNDMKVARLLADNEPAGITEEAIAEVKSQLQLLPGGKQ